MTNAKIFVGTKMVETLEAMPTGAQHTFLFYDGDGDSTGSVGVGKE